MLDNNDLIIDYSSFIRKHNIRDSFLVGSIVIGSLLNRKVGDLDFSTSNNKESKKIESMYKKGCLKLLLFSFHLHLFNDIDYYNNRYLILNLPDKKIIKNGLFSEKNGIRFVVPEVEIAYKKISRREKDIIDLDYITKKHYNDIEWDKVERIISNHQRKMNIKRIFVVINKLTYKFLNKIKKILTKSFN